MPAKRVQTSLPPIPHRDPPLGHSKPRSYDTSLSPPHQKPGFVEPLLKSKQFGEPLRKMNINLLMQKADTRTKPDIYLEVRAT